MNRALLSLEPEQAILRLQKRRQLKMVAAGLAVAAALAAAFAAVVLTYNDDPEGQFRQPVQQAP